jgi:hypothetical protein
MNHKKYQEQLELMLYGELPGPEREEAERHMAACEACRAHFEELQKLHGVLAHYVPLEATDQLLHEARAGLRSALVQTPQRRGLGEWLAGLFFPDAGPRYALALAGAAAAAVGFFLGYLVFTPRAGQIDQQAPAVAALPAKEERPMLPEGGQIMNVRFLDSNVQAGEVEFTFDAVVPMHMKGKVNEPQIQQVLSYALLNEQNPGTRLRSVNAMASEKAAGADEDVKKVLIAVLRSDDNPGVRKEALEALQKFRYDDDIKRAYMSALARDPNSAIRIEAIKALKSASPKNIGADQALVEMFRDKVKSDDNPYVRIQAKAVLQEIKQ